MKIETDSFVIYNFIQAELEVRYTNLVLSARQLPFTDIEVISTRNLPEFLLKDFSQNIVNKIKEFEQKDC